ncbi:primosomal protein DnaI [Bacillus massiliigorillae]|uniref:primosomal protein DnaI n=1 Tax=Bacillus massiliigorillae TaxID=1243664 RepID=UPI00039D4374|nr:primosomal protein DnaI [Bacillus massiliigorillae]
MRKINQALSGLTHTNDFSKRYEAIRKETLSHPDIQEFLNRHSSLIDEETVEKSLMKFYDYTTQQKDCSHCPSLTECKNTIKGFIPHMKLQGKAIELFYEPCPTKKKADERRHREKLIQSLYIPRDILSATLFDIDINSSVKAKAVEAADRFIDDYMSGKKPKALYFYGSFGVGKTYLLGAIANDLADKNISSLLVYVPDFLREIKSAIGDNTLNEKLEFVKNAPVLMLDDIGAETMTSWSRDEVLGPILQHRMADQLPTFFTSNFDFAQLQNHLTYSQRGEKEEVKAARIMERIKTLADPYLLDGTNRRQ